MKYTILSITLFIGALGFSQQTISGTVTNSFGDPIPNVNITLLGTSKGAPTDTNGNYAILVPNLQGALQFSVLGYDNQTIPIHYNLIIDATLIETSQQLDEVVITALGFKRETKELGYAVQSLNAKGVTEVKSANFLDNLSGKLAGVTINQGATGVGSSSKITIRGEASFSNNNPLFVVDGVPINNNSVFQKSNKIITLFT